jgi:hypothetical protein
MKTVHPHLPMRKYHAPAVQYAQRQWTPEDLMNLLTGEGFTAQARRHLPFVFWQASFHHFVATDKIIS